MADSWSTNLSSLVTSVPVTGLVALTLGVILLVKWLLTPDSDTDIPPFPEKPYPILGHLPYLVKDKRAVLLNWRKTTGDVFSLYMGSRLFIILSGYTAIKEALVTNAHAFSSRPKQVYMDDAEHGVSFSNGEHWKEQRTLSLNILKSFGMGKTSLASKISTEVSSYLDELTRLKCTDVRYMTNVSIANNICNILIGRRFDYQDKFFVAFIDNMIKTVAAGDNAAFVMIWPWLRRLPGNILDSKSSSHHLEAIMTNFCDHFIKETREAEDKCHCFISEYDKEMQRLKKSGKETTVNDRNLRFIVMQLFIAGTDTVAMTIVWLMNYMIHHPHIQSKVYDEIVKSVGKKRVPDMNDKPNLPYTQAVIMETMRLASIVPTNPLMTLYNTVPYGRPFPYKRLIEIIPHHCDEDTIIQGHRIPAGATVLPSLDSVLWDEDLWENPMTFHPERFLDDSGNCMKPEEFIPFSIGRRLCLGDALAKMELFLYVTSLIQRFEVLPVDPNNLPTLEAKTGILTPPQNATFIFRERRSE